MDLTATQATAMLNTFTSSTQGFVPASGGGTTTFLRADETLPHQQALLHRNLVTLAADGKYKRKRQTHLLMLLA